MNQQIFDMFDSVTEQMTDETQNKEDTVDKMNEMKDVTNIMGTMMDDFMNN